MSRIFISHSSANNAAALALSQWLDENGWDDHFLDIDEERGITPGERWMAALNAAVDRCEAVLFLVSPAWRDSKFCFAEFYQAKNLGKRIFGLIIEPLPLEQLPPQMTAEWQVCDLSEPHDAQSFSVERLPKLPRCEVKFSAGGLAALARGLRRAGLSADTFEWPPKDEPQRSPYPGLRALDAADAAIFFGRDAYLVHAMDQIRRIRERGVERLMVILGASGAGKSSFLRAGLLPRLRRDAEHFAVLRPIRPEHAVLSGEHGLLKALKQALVAEAGESISAHELAAELAQPDGIGLALGGPLRRIAEGKTMAAGSAGRTLILPIDQAEELFNTEGQDEVQRLLHGLLQLNTITPTADSAQIGPPLRLLCLLTLRSDALPLLQQEQQDEAIMRAFAAPVLFSLPAMPAAEFKAVIEGPAQRHSAAGNHKLTVSTELSEALVADAQGSDALPLLALTLELLFRQFGKDGKDCHLQLSNYRDMGGVAGVIQEAVKQALARPSLPPAIPADEAAQNDLLRTIFPLIASVDPDSGGWKRRVAQRSELAALPSATAAAAMVERLVRQRLLISDRQTEAGVAGQPAMETLEVAHEALLRQWALLRDWLQQFGEQLAGIEKVQRAAKDWQRGQQQPSDEASPADADLLLHRGQRLLDAEAWASDPALSRRFGAADKAYLQACRAHEQDQLRAREAALQEKARQQSARARLQRIITWGLSSAGLLTLSLLVWIVLQTQNVSRQTSLVLSAVASQAVDEGSFDQALRLAVLASRGDFLHPPHKDAAAVLIRAGNEFSFQPIPAGNRIAQFSPEGQTIVTATDDGTVRFWKVQTGQPLGEPMKHRSAVTSVKFSPDGRTLVTTSWDNTARLWDARTGLPRGEPMEHEDLVFSAQFSPDGRTIVTGSGAFGIDTRFSPKLREVPPAARGSARLWEVQTGRQLGEPMKHQGPVLSAQFSPDGQTIVTASRDETARLWEAQTGWPLGEPMKHQGRFSNEGIVLSAQFSPDGRTIVTASEDGTARLWESQTGRPLGEKMTHVREVRSAQFSPDGRTIVTASWDGTARLWDAQTGHSLGKPMNHEDAVYSAQFSPDGRTIMTTEGGSSGQAHLWDAKGRPLIKTIKLKEPIYFAQFSLDGRTIVTVSEKSARLWRIDWSKPANHSSQLARACGVMGPEARSLTKNDLVFAKQLIAPERLGEDVCKGITPMALPEDKAVVITASAAAPSPPSASSAPKPAPQAPAIPGTKPAK